MPPVAECEVNPLVFLEGRAVALDVLARLAGESEARAAPRPLDKLVRVLEPAWIAVMGVSRHRNPGRIILENILRAGFPARRVWVIKPGVGEVEGCPAVTSLDDLPGAVDLLVLAVSAEEIPGVVDQVVEMRCAESIIVVSGGLGESCGSESGVGRIRVSLERARSTDWRGPLVNGGNCLGIRSRPGRYNTLFIPGYKHG